MCKRPASRQANDTGNTVPKAWNRRHAHAVGEATKVVLMRPLVAVMDKRHEIDLRATSKHAECVVRSNAVATVRGVRQSVGKIKDPHRKTKVRAILPDLQDKVLPKSDFFPHWERLGMILTCVTTIVAMVYAKIETSAGTGVPFAFQHRNSLYRI